MFDDYINLRPLKGVAEILANDNSWGQLYNLDQLAKNEVAISAATYVNFLIPSVSHYQNVAPSIRYYEDMYIFRIP
jgi:hypothetical protein